MMNKIILLIGLIGLQLPLLASNANANASATAVPVGASAEADKKSGAKAPVLSDEARKKGYSYTVEECERIIELFQRSSLDEFRAALDRGEITATQWVQNASIWHFALYCGTTPVEKLALLLERGADMNEPDESGNPPIFTLFQGPVPNAKALRFLYTLGVDVTVDSFLGPRGVTQDSVLHALCTSSRPDNGKCIETCVVLGVNLEAGTNNWRGDVSRHTPLWKAIYLFSPREMFNCRSIETLVGCGADTTVVEEAIRNGCHRNQPNREPMIRERLARGEEIFIAKQLPLVRQQLQETFADYQGYQVLGNELAPIINGYAGRLILPRRVYTDTEKRKALDELVAFQEAEEKREASAQQADKPAEQPK